MKQITIKKLAEKINNKKVQLEFEGTIQCKQKIKIKEIILSKDYLEIYYQGKTIKLNIHQITKIEIISIEKIKINFDGFQSIYISILF